MATSPATNPPTLTPATTGTTSTSAGVATLIWPRSGTISARQRRRRRQGQERTVHRPGPTQPQATPRRSGADWAVPVPPSRPARCPPPAEAVTRRAQRRQGAGGLALGDEQRADGVLGVGRSQHQDLVAGFENGVPPGHDHMGPAHDGHDRRLPRHPQAGPAPCRRPGNQGQGSPRRGGHPTTRAA